MLSVITKKRQKYFKDMHLQKYGMHTLNSVVHNFLYEINFKKFGLIGRYHVSDKIRACRTKFTSCKIYVLADGIFKILKNFGII